MPSRFTQITDLAEAVQEHLDLAAAEVEVSTIAAVILENRDLFVRYANITDAQYDALCRAVWANVMVGQAYPFEEAQ